MNARLPSSRPLGQALVDAGILSEDQRRIALLEQARREQPFGRLLVALGFVSEATLREALSERLGRQSVELAHAIIDPAALERVPRELALRHRLLPLEYRPDVARFSLAISDPTDLVALDEVRRLLPEDTEIVALVAGESEITLAIDHYYGYEMSIDGILNEIETGELDAASLQARADEYSQPVVRLIDSILADAVKHEASDIHFEPEQNFLRIRYRIDGLLRQIRSLHKSYWPAMAVRLKVMSGMNIAETRSPQDGRIGLTLSGRPIDFRAAIQPTIHGENIVLRVLDRQKGIVPLSRIGLSGEQTAALERMLARPEGVLLVTGPTGSGKTTMLYSLLGHLNAEGVNIMTLEDPVEYPLGMVRQTSVSDGVKLDFASGVRSILRQDPDVILVGEIRDRETAEMAFRAAMTGHQVFSTLHTSSAVGAIPRLLDIGIPADILAGNLIGIVAQRLVRRLCPHCRRPHAASPDEMRLLGRAPDAEAPTLFRPEGCERCAFQGYRGRFAVMELLRIDGELDESITRGATTREIRALARAHGFRTLADDGVQRVLEGRTSLAELGRVVDLTDRM